MEGDFRVGDWLVHPDRDVIESSEKSIQLEPKAMDLLVYLADHAGQVVPKERLIQAVWSDAFVTDEVLTNNIWKLRQAFGDDPKSPRFIETVTRKGYRLIAPVTPEDALEGEVASPSYWGLAAGLLVLIVAGTLAFTFDVEGVRTRLMGDVAPGEITSIAVLPLLNSSGNPDADYLSHGIAANISSSLSQIEELRVVPSSALSRYREETAYNPQHAAKELNVQGIVAGSLLQSGDTFAVTVELVDGRENRLIWGEQYTQDSGDIFEIQAQIAQEITQSLRLKLTEQQQEGLKRRYTQNEKAWDLYLRGEFLLEQGDFKGAINYFDEAIKEDPEFALAYIGLGDAFVVSGFYRNLKTDYDKARTYLEKAIDLDDTLPRAHQHLGWVLRTFDRDWSAAEKEYRRAVELDPRVGPEQSYLMWMGRYEEATAKVESDRGISDPLSSDSQTVVGWQYYYLRNYDRAIEQARMALALDPTSNKAMELLGSSYLARGMFSEFIAEAKRTGQSEATLESWRRAYLESGIEGFWQAFFDTGQVDRPHYEKSRAYALMGERDLAFEWLGKACELPVTAWFFADAAFDSLRSDPRYEQLMRETLKVPEEAIKRILAEHKRTP